jgi:hypothetical protein
MPYYNDPSSDIAAGMQGNFNPMTGRLNTGNMILEFLARMAGQKEKAKQDEWAVEDRDINKRYKEAQIRNYDEATPAKVVVPTSKVSPIMVKNMMKKLDYPDEVVSEVDTMNEPALAAAWTKTQQDFAARQLQGIRVPKTAASQRGKLQQAQLKAALDTVKSRGTRYSAALSQLYSNPDKGMLVEDKITGYEKTLDDIERQAGEIASMMSNIDESGELTEDQFAKLNTILKFKSSYRPMPGGNVLKKKARSSTGREIDVISKDGGKTWLDAQGNVIPIK